MIIAGKSPPAVSSPTLFDSPTVWSSAVSCRRLAVGETDDHYFVRKSVKYWDKFYERHQHKFFKDRHYLEKDWGHYFADSDDCAASANGKVLLEIGCGAGNTIFPLIAAYPNLFVHACDFSQLAIDLVKSHPKFCADWINVFVCDVASQELCDYIQPSSVDVVTLIFMLSAVSPDKMPFVLQSLKKVLKPNGQILLRDYAVGDYAQVRFLLLAIYTFGICISVEFDGRKICFRLLAATAYGELQVFRLSWKTKAKSSVIIFVLEEMALAHSISLRNSYQLYLQRLVSTRWK